MAKETFVLKSNLDCQTSSLTDEEFGKLIRKVFKYVKGESTDLLEEKLELVFGFIKADIDKNIEKYEETCRKRKAAAEARWQNSNANVNNNMQNMQMHNLHYDNDNEYDYDNKLSKDNYDIKERKELNNYMKSMRNKPKLDLIDYNWFDDETEDKYEKNI